jgi:hypothetical protein
MTTHRRSIDSQHVRILLQQDILYEQRVYRIRHSYLDPIRRTTPREHHARSEAYRSTHGPPPLAGFRNVPNVAIETLPSIWRARTDK